MVKLGPTRKYYPGWWNFGGIDGFPVSGSLSSPFGPREPIWTPNGPTSPFHTGIDIPAAAGTAVLMPAPGYVIHQHTDEVGPYGNMVHVRFEDGSGAAFLHLRKDTPMVGVGQRLRRGDIVGLVGTTGLSTGDHLHFSTLRQVPESMPQGYAAYWPLELFTDPMDLFFENVSDVVNAVYTGRIVDGQSSYVVTTVQCTPDEIRAQAHLVDGAYPEAMFIYGGYWIGYVFGAPDAVNAEFPEVLDAGTPVFVRG